MADWTLFYWAWWIAWSPFVDVFIARISRGRTVREFVIGVLLVPTAFTFLWMTVFGNSAMGLDLGVAGGAISDAVQADLSTALFHFLEYLPGTAITSTLAVALVTVFFDHPRPISARWSSTPPLRRAEPRRRRAGSGSTGAGFWG